MKLSELKLELEVFQGPLALLCHLIEKNEIDIYDIPISDLTDQYIAYLERMPKKDMEHMSEFVVMTATLLEIKSKMLLPKPVKEEVIVEEDPREELVRRLLEYQKIKLVTEEFKEQEEQSSTIYYKEADPILKTWKPETKEETLEEFLDKTSIEALYEAFQLAIQRKENKIDHVRIGFKRVVKDIFTIEEKMEFIRDLLILNTTLQFSEIFRPHTDKMEKVITFLALLELTKGKEVYVIQERAFEEIMIQKREE